MACILPCLDAGNSIGTQTMKTAVQKSTSRRTLALALISALLVGAQSHAIIVFTIEDPGDQQTTVAGAVTETFDSHALGALGTFVSPVGTFVGGTVLAADQFGGANSTRYNLAAGLQSGASSTLNLSTPQKYVGFWWSAGDVRNQVEFYDPSLNLLAVFNTASIIPFLSPAYYSNPNPPPGRNSAEPYAYFNFTATGSETIGQVVFRQIAGGGGFEIDNVSVFDQPITPPGHTLPEGGPLVPVLAGAIGALALLRRKMK
jgi:hypothetical protein